MPSTRYTVIHAVPENERAVGEDGTRKPFGIFGDAYFEQHTPRDYGAFGSRSRRAPSRRPQAESENEEWNRQREDEIFGALFSPSSSQNQPPPPAGAGQLTRSATTQSISSIGSSRRPVPFSRPSQSDIPEQRENLPFSQSFQPSNSTSRLPDAQQLTTTTNTLKPTPSVLREPTEVTLRGFPSDSQWRALEFFDSAAGTILEDYAREPPGKLYSFGSGIPGPNRPLTRAEKEKVNKYRGGAHWIKITFETREQAEEAVELSPRQIDNFWVTAELWSGVAVTSEEDVPWFVSKFPRGPPSRRQNSFHNTGAIAQNGGNVQQALLADQPSSASTYTKAVRSINRFTNDPRGSLKRSTSALTLSSSQPPPAPDTAQASDRAAAAARRRELLQAKAPIVLPDEQLYLPQPSAWANYWQGSWLGALVGQAKSDPYGGDAPIRADGTFDWEAAGWYWQICWWIDRWVPWLDLVGSKGEKVKTG